MLGSIRAGLVVALAIPLSMLFATNIMSATGSHGQPDEPGGDRLRPDRRQLGDHDRKLHAPAVAPARGTSRTTEIMRDAAIEVRKPTMFGELIIAVVYLPILALQGTEGKLFKPMALTVLFALAARWCCR